MLTQRRKGGESGRRECLEAWEMLSQKRKGGESGWNGCLEVWGHLSQRLNGVMGVLVVVLLLGGLVGCAGEGQEEETARNSQEYVEIRGETMGTTYIVKHQKVFAVDYTDSIEALLRDINMAVSTYIPDANISIVNRGDTLRMPTDRQGRQLRIVDRHFKTVYTASVQIYEMTEGAFDPTVAPLVNAWGFGWEGRKPVFPDSSVIDSLLGLVGMENISQLRVGPNREIVAEKPGVMLDYSAIAKGYGVDQIAEFLESNGLYDYFVEIGGEVRVSGQSPRGDAWIVGINRPEEQAGRMEVVARLVLDKGSLATSGNYRNFYEVDGRRVWHTINPETGYPEENSILSVSVVNPRCMTADALATACMVKGFPEALEFVETLENTEAYFIYTDEDGDVQTAMTPGFSQYLIDNATESQ